jgi:hypothetical protein
MTKRLIAFLGTTLLLLALTAAAIGQVQTTTVTKVQQNPDGTYSIVEYPVGKETVVTLNPVGINATGTATIIRKADGTTIKVNLASVPADVAGLNLYAVDPTGAVNMLGPIDIANGTGTFATTVPLTRFMLFASPEADLSAYDPNTKVFFRSGVPTGFTVIPLGQNMAVGEQVGAATALSDYAVPMLGIPTFKAGDETKLKINFSGAMEGARANVFIEPHKNGKTTEVRMRFHDLKEAPKGTAFILWAVSAAGEYQQLGQIVNVKGRNEAEIKSETAFDDFGLLLTAEDLGLTKGTIIHPAGHRVGVIEIIR